MKSFRDLPSVDEVLKKIGNADGAPREVITDEIRTVLAKARESISRGECDLPDVAETVTNRLRAFSAPSLRHVINATGVILHTNLGRAPLPAFAPIDGYSNLEYDLEAGKRGKRDKHASTLLERILDAPGLAVNNNAAAVFLVLNELASGGEVIVSRGELIEIGDGFRIPEIMARSGAILREIGTTNRTRIEDYKNAIGERTRLILRVHPSNFRISGFTSRPTLKELAGLAHEFKLALYEDLGSGCLIDLRTEGIEEPLVKDSLRQGADLVSFSCDKLLGGPQSGIVAGKAELLQRIRRNPMYRAFRIDKLTIQALETTLRHVLHQNWNAIPALQMILQTTEEIRKRAERVCTQLRVSQPYQICQSNAAIGGGSTPDQQILSWAIEIAPSEPITFERKLREADPPVVARIERDRVIIDLRTVRNEDEAGLIAALNSAGNATQFSHRQ